MLGECMGLPLKVEENMAYMFWKVGAFDDN